MHPKGHHNEHSIESNDRPPSEDKHLPSIHRHHLESIEPLQHQQIDEGNHLLFDPCWTQPMNSSSSRLLEQRQTSVVTKEDDVSILEELFDLHPHELNVLQPTIQSFCEESSLGHLMPNLKNQSSSTLSSLPPIECLQQFSMNVISNSCDSIRLVGSNERNAFEDVIVNRNVGSVGVGGCCVAASTMEMSCPFENTLFSNTCSEMNGRMESLKENGWMRRTLVDRMNESSLTTVVSAVGSEFGTLQFSMFGRGDTCQQEMLPMYLLQPQLPCMITKSYNKILLKKKVLPQAWKEALENQRVKKQIQKQRKMLQREKIIQRRRELYGRVAATELSSTGIRSKREITKPEMTRMEIPLTEFKKQNLDKRKSLMRELSLEWIICEEVLLRLLQFRSHDVNQLPEMIDDDLIEQVEQQLNDEENQRQKQLSQIMDGIYQKSVKSLQRLYDLLNTDSMDIEDIIDTILDSDTLSHVKSYYLDRSILGKYLNVLNDSTISLMNETLEDTPTQLDGMIQRIQHFAVSIVKKLSANGRIDQIQTLSNQLDVPLMIQLVHSRHLPIANDALFILANIAKSSSSQRDQILDGQIVKEIAWLMSTRVINEEDEQQLSLMRMAAWCFSKLCVGSPSPSKEHMKQLLTLTPYFLHRKDIETLTHTCRAIGRLMYPKEMITPFLQTGQSTRMIALLNNRSESEYNLLAQALVAAVNISAGTDEETQHLVTLNILDISLKILRLPMVPKSIRIDAMILVSNVCACTEDQVQKAIDCGVLEEIALIFNRKDTLMDLKKEAVWIFRNAANSGLDAHIELFVERYQIVPPLCEMIVNGHSETQIKNMCMQTLVKILEYYEEREERSEEMEHDNQRGKTNVTERRVVEGSHSQSKLKSFNEILSHIQKSGAAKEILQMDIHSSEYVETLSKFLLRS